MSKTIPSGFIQQQTHYGFMEKFKHLSPDDQAKVEAFLDSLDDAPEPPEVHVQGKSRTPSPAARLHNAINLAFGRLGVTAPDELWALYELATQAAEVHAIGNVLRCRGCGGQGWYVRPNINTGEPEQVQCECTAETHSMSSFHGLDNERQVFFYEHDFYVLSNFAAFRLEWEGLTFDTSEAAYQWNKFPSYTGLQDAILRAKSAHEAYKIAEGALDFCRHDWPEVRVGIMRDILRAKAAQHEYVRRKLLDTGDRELIEDSWRDGFWGWGPNRDGKNMLGGLWMEVRAELRAKTPSP